VYSLDLIILFFPFDKAYFFPLGFCYPTRF